MKIRISDACQSFGNVMLFPLYRIYEFLNFCNLRVEHLLEELRGEFLTDGEFIGSLHRLVEVAAKPAEVLLELHVKGGHLVQSIDLTDSCRVIELLHGIPNHCADGGVTGCFALKQGFFFGREPNPEAFRFLLHRAVILL